MQPPTSVKFSDNETWSRLNADPLLTMKRVEIDKVKQMRDNLKVAKLQVSFDQSSVSCSMEWTARWSYQNEHVMRNAGSYPVRGFTTMRECCMIACDCFWNNRSFIAINSWMASSGPPF